MDELSIGGPGSSLCVGVLRNSNVISISRFALNIGIDVTLHTEFTFVIEININYLS